MMPVDTTSNESKLPENTRNIELQIESSLSGLPDIDTLTTWTVAARLDDADSSVVIRIVDAEESRQLNRDFRGKDAPTNVLSFPFEAPPDIPEEHLGDLVSKQLNRTLDCFARMDDEEALKIISMDNKINEEFESLTRQLITLMMEDPRTIRHALRVSWCARALERIGDHSKNICEYVVFLVQGKDVRHLDLDDNKG